MEKKGLLRGHIILYDDGHKLKHNLGVEQWELEPAAAQPASKVADIDQRLWPGAAAAGWTVKAGHNYNWTYVAPDGRMSRPLESASRWPSTSLVAAHRRTRPPPSASARWHTGRRYA